MKIDLLVEMPTPGPRHALRQEDPFTQALEQIELADRAGFGCLWAVEERFLSDPPRSSSPEILLCAAAQRTERIRLGCGATRLPAPFNHPIRVAERVAALDILSGGRVEWATRRAEREEPGTAECDPQASADMWQEAVEIIPRLWAPGACSFRGRFFDIPEHEVLPKPVQDPHPPLWLVATSADGWRAAAGHGLGVLSLTSDAKVDSLVEQVRDYRAASIHAQPLGRRLHDQVAVLVTDPGTDASRSSSNGDALRERLEHYRDAGCDRVLLGPRPRARAHSEQMRSLERIGERVIPHFDDRR